MHTQRRSASNLYYTVMDVKKEKSSAKIKSPSFVWLPSARAYKQTSTYGHLFYSCIALVTIVMLVRYQFTITESNTQSQALFSSAPISSVISSLKSRSVKSLNFLHDRDVRPSSIPFLPNSRDDFLLDPVERFDVDGRRPLGFGVVGLVILIMGLLIGL